MDIVDSRKLTEEQGRMLSTLRKEAENNPDWVDFKNRFDLQGYKERFATSLQEDKKTDVFWRLFVFMKSSEIFPNVRNFRWFDNSYIDQLKQELKGVGNITKGKNDLILSMPNGKYHIRKKEDTTGSSVIVSIFLFETLNVIYDSYLYFFDTPDVVAKKLILMDTLVGTEYRDEFEKLKLYLKSMEMTRAICKMTFESSLKDAMGSRVYSIKDVTMRSVDKVKYQLQMGESTLDMELSIDDVDFSAVAVKFVELYDLLCRP